MKLATQTIDALAQLLIELEQTTPKPEIVLIGGQALFLWAERYLIDKVTQEEFAHATSFDLDFLGKRVAIEQCAEAWGGECTFPRFGDFTPQSGKVALEDIDGKPVLIDFLGQVDGLSGSDLDKRLDQITIEYDGQEVEVPILSPPLCLKARIYNAFHRGYSNGLYQREIARIGLAIKATKYYINDLAAAYGFRPGLRVAEYLYKIMLSRDARRLYREHGISVLDAIPSSGSIWPEAFLERRYPQMLAKQQSFRVAS